MEKSTKRFAAWAAALLITLFVASAQRITGPSYPLKGKETIGNETIVYRFNRSAVSGTALKVSVSAGNISGSVLHFRRLNSDDLWADVPMEKEGEGVFSASVPSQPPAGKVEYKVSVIADNAVFILNQGNPVVVRFRGAVPTGFLVLHIFLMFSGMLFASRCLFCGRDTLRFKKGMVHMTTAQLFLGGLVFGPIVQKYAFNRFWTGFPFGTDMTDNKMLIIVVIWLAALFTYSRKKTVLIVASLLTFLIYLVPHSVLGSELDFKTGQHKNVFIQDHISGER